MNLFAGPFTVLLLGASPALAQSHDVCKSFQEQVIQPITIDTALARYKAAVLKKDEFETTVQFQARQQTAVGTSTGPIIISKVVDPQYIKYDADTQEFTVQTYLFDNQNMNYDVLGYPKPIGAGIVGNVDIVISETEMPSGTYEASNSYGAKTTVVKIARVTKGVWERSFPSMTNDLFQNGASGANLVTLKLPPEQAKAIKGQLRIAFLVVPKFPYIVHGVGPVGRTTVARPIEITNDLTVLTADIQCAFLTDGANKVLGSFPTN